MSTAALIQRAHAAGVSLQLIDGKVKARGTQAAVTALIEPLREHKADLIRWLTAASEMVRRIANPASPEEQALVTFRLLNAAMHVCDAYGDSEAAREAMRVQCLEVPEHLHAELLEALRFIRRPEAKAAPATQPKKAPEPPQDPQQWRELAAAYNLHHTTCRTCQAAGQGRGIRCGTGAALFTAYQSSN
jgi:hypothetical protein